MKKKNNRDCTCNIHPTDIHETHKHAEVKLTWKTLHQFDMKYHVILTTLIK